MVLSADELQRMLGKKGKGWTRVCRWILHVLEIDKANATQEKYRDDNAPDFSAHVLSEIGCTYHLPEGELDRIPAEGGFITVSNHHFGAIDGLILVDTVGRKRPDYKILTTFLLALIPNLKDAFMPVDNLSGTKADARSVNGIRLALNQIHDGHPLGFFPAGEVATWQFGKRRTTPGFPPVIEDKPWADNIIKLVRKSGFPVIPIYFEGRNSLSFHLLGLLHRRLRTIRLVHELFNKRGHHVEVRIGEPISPEQIQAWAAAGTLGAELRSHTYGLAPSSSYPA